MKVKDAIKALKGCDPDLELRITVRSYTRDVSATIPIETVSRVGFADAISVFFEAVIHPEAIRRLYAPIRQAMQDKLETARKQAHESAAQQIPPFESVLREANSLVHGERRSDYGHPINDFSCAAKMISAFLSRKHGQVITLGAEDIPAIMILVKMSREAHKPKRDNRVDVAGYAETLEMVYHELGRQRRQAENT